MKTIVKTAAFCAAFLVSGTPMIAEEMTQTDIAKKYYLALYADDKDTVRELAAPDMAFQDPTAPDAYGVPVLNELELIFDVFSGVSGGGVTVEFIDSYASNDQVVLVVELSGTIPAAAVGMEEGDVSVATNGVTVLQVSGGKIASHTDYFNYPRLEQSITPVQ